MQRQPDYESVSLATPRSGDQRGVPLLGTVLRRFRRDSLLSNSSYIMATTLVTSAFGYIYWILAARSYAAYDVGLASSLISAMTITSILSNLGVGPALIHHLPKRTRLPEWMATFNIGILVVIISGFLAGGAVAILLPILLPQYAILMWQPVFKLFFVCCIVFWNISTILDQTFVAERAASNMLVRNTIFALLKIAFLILPLLFLPAGALLIFASWALGAAASIFAARYLLLPRVRRGYRFSFAGARSQAGPLISSLAGQHFINIGGIAPMYLLPMIVTVRLSTTESAYFYTTWMLGSLCFLFSPAVASSLFAEGAHSYDGLAKKVQRSVLIIAALLVPGEIVLFIGGKLILSVFGAPYAANGYGLLLVLLVSAIPDAVTNLYVSVQRVYGHVYRAAALNLSMAGITLVSAWLLLPRFGLVGAGLGWLLGQTAGSIFAGAHMLFAPVLRQFVRVQDQPHTASVASAGDAFGLVSPGFDAEPDTELDIELAGLGMDRSQLTSGLLFDAAVKPAPMVRRDQRSRSRPTATSTRPKFAVAGMNALIISILMGGLILGHFSQPAHAALDRPSSADLTPLPLTIGVAATATSTSTPRPSATPTSTPLPAPTATTVPKSSPTATAVPLTVSDAVISAPNTGYTTCPAQLDLVFTADLTFPSNNAGGIVTYQWIHSDGSTEPAQEVTVPPGGTSAMVQDSWAVPATAGTGQAFSDMLHITTPNSFTSNTASYQLTCPFRVTGIQVTANPSAADAPCGQSISFTFTGILYVTNSPGGTITYSWTEPDGTTNSGTATVAADGQTSVTVTEVWSPTALPANGTYSESLTVSAPNTTQPGSATVSVAC